MAKETKLIHFAVMSSQGDTPYDMLPEAALTKIKAIADDEDKWVFLDGELKDPGQISTGELERAESILLSAALEGGAEQYAVVFNVADDFKYTGNTVLAIKLGTEPDVIDIVANGKRVKEIFMWRSVLYGLIETGFNNLVSEEYNSVMESIGEDTMCTRDWAKGTSVNASFADAIKPAAQVVIGFDSAHKALTLRVSTEERYDVLNARKHILAAIKKQLEGTVQQHAHQLAKALRI